MAVLRQGPRTGGPAGPKGDTGATGPQGPKGDAGPAGAVGAVGAKGDTGSAGPAGAAGPKGDAGATGAKGDTGAQGPAGDSRIWYSKVVDVPAQSSGTYAHPQITLGARATRPAVKVTVECASRGLIPNFVVSGNSAGWKLDVSVQQQRSTVDISLGALLGVNLLTAAIPAFKLHISAEDQT